MKLEAKELCKEAKSNRSKGKKYLIELCDANGISGVSGKSMLQLARRVTLTRAKCIELEIEDLGLDKDAETDYPARSEVDPHHLDGNLKTIIQKQMLQLWFVRRISSAKMQESFRMGSANVLHLK
mmetsp:Transcript_2312/g.2953  ORF Transcript_2312/g.2953 Transcript_2312/m.2953 type:complete len:125 (+) Transcript_2312:304-678(+)